MGKAMFELALVCLPQIDSLLDFGHDCLLPIDSLDPCYTGNGNTGFRKDIISGSNFMTNFSRRGPKFADPMAFNRMKSPCYPAYMRPDYSFILYH